MKSIAFFLVAVCFVAPATAAEFPTIKGWNPEGDVATYGPDALWEHINGAAETFIQYGFQELKNCELSKEGVTVAVEIYDMGSALNAFGMYRTELPEDAETIAIGGQAQISLPYQALLVKDRFYVKVDVYDGELDEAGGRSLLLTVANALPGGDGLPKEFAKLPAQGMVKGSQRFTREAFLGLRELVNCVSAEYENGAGGTYRVFTMLPQTGETSDSVWKTLAAKWTSVEHNPEPVLAKKIPYTGHVGVILTSKGIFGVVGGDDKDAMLKALTQF